MLDLVMSNVQWVSRTLTVNKRNFAVEVRTVNYKEHDDGTYFRPKVHYHYIYMCMLP